MALAKATALAPELRDWMSTCPDPSVFAAAVAHQVWLKDTDECTQCGEKYLNEDMRPDQSYWSTGKPICKECWQTYDAAGSLGNPNFRSPPWPAVRAEIEEIPLVDGILRDRATGKGVGVVRGYNPKNHFANRVDRFWGEAEAGSIDPAVEAVTDREPVDAPVTNGKAQEIFDLLTGAKPAAIEIEADTD